MKWTDISDLDFSNTGAWPLPAKVLATVCLCALVLGAVYWFDTQHQWTNLKDEERKEQGLKDIFEDKQRKAANLEAYREQLEQIKETFGTLLRQLPGKAEVAELLVDVSQTGLAAGLEFELFKPGTENAAEFYAELPIDIRVIGDYHQFGAFVSGVAALPRIVALHDFNITPRKADEGKLVMEVTAKTYRYIDEEEQAKEEPAK
jgi:type IV pilus assembly protein PilO